MNDLLTMDELVKEFGDDDPTDELQDAYKTVLDHFVWAYAHRASITGESVVHTKCEWRDLISRHVASEMESYLHI